MTAAKKGSGQDRIMEGRAIRHGASVFTTGDEAKLAAANLHPDDLQLMANRGDIVGFGTEDVGDDEVDAEASHPMEYAERRKADVKAAAARAAEAGPLKPGTADHLKLQRSGVKMTGSSVQDGDPTHGTDSQRSAPKVPEGSASGNPTHPGNPGAPTGSDDPTAATGKVTTKSATKSAAKKASKN
jgi:hypothetical protein